MGYKGFSYPQSFKNWKIGDKVIFNQDVKAWGHHRTFKKGTEYFIKKIETYNPGFNLYLAEKGKNAMGISGSDIEKIV